MIKSLALQKGLDSTESFQSECQYKMCVSVFSNVGSQLFYDHPVHVNNLQFMCVGSQIFVYV
jgi:hypothetical protein